MYYSVTLRDVSVELWPGAIFSHNIEGKDITLCVMGIGDIGEGLDKQYICREADPIEIAKFRINIEKELNET